MKAEEKRRAEGWGYYFNEGSEVMLDDCPSNINMWSQIPKDRLWKKATVQKCYCEMHAFAQGSIYRCAVKFDDGYELEALALSFVYYNDNGKI